MKELPSTPEWSADDLEACKRAGWFLHDRPKRGVPTWSEATRAFLDGYRIGKATAQDTNTANPKGSPASVAQSETARRLTQKAQVGNTIFDAGIEERLVIDRAIREYGYQHTPEKEAERLQRVGEFRKALGVCPKCGTNRFMAACPNGHMAEAMGQCPMVGSAEGPK